ncbi:MAG: chemotaxis protein CheB, partial [Gemmatimonadetes bacterium]|nr:chemotaxis protein CheB [Gemmatimonadota bacterium]
STGGPAALHRILLDLPRDFPVPILVVQHIARNFVTGLCTWLNAHCDLRVRVAEHGEALEPRSVYLAPDDRHLGVRERGVCELSAGPPVGAFRPSGSFLFESVARIYGAAAVAVVLTGMGRDGAEGALAVRAAGGRVLAQDEETSIVYGMPAEAVRIGAAQRVLRLERIAPTLMDLIQGGHGGT